MRLLPRVTLLAFLPLLLLARPTFADSTAYKPSPQARVIIDDGALQGALPAPGVRAFLGIPYAAPPVGPLRWQPPAPYGQWKGTRLAVKHGAPCPQQKFGWNDWAAEHGSEDCLFLNVWAPVSGEHHPVMVYIHGGSNVAGTASEDLSNGLTLVPRGVVLVTLDYRLGIFGFFRTPALDGESVKGASGDYGLLDQIAALRWVRQNIASFGGDPKNVTVFGQSAGAVDTGLLLTSPLAKGLFAKAMEESGQVLGLMPTATAGQSEKAWAPVAASLGKTLHAMRAATTAQVLAADKAAPPPPAGNFWGYRGASVDGWVLPRMPYEVYAHGAEAPVPLLIGSNVQEIVPAHESDAELQRSMDAALGPVEAKRLAAVYAKPGASPMLGNAADRWATDHDFRCAVRQVADWHSGHGIPTYVYQFDQPLPGNATALHSSELFFVFHSFPAKGGPSPLQNALSNIMQQYWTGYAKHGDPNTPGLPEWPRYTGAVRAYMHFPAGGAAPAAQVDLGGEACAILSPALARHD
jgi:para-nitrobenzyl esterase